MVLLPNRRPFHAAETKGAAAGSEKLENACKRSCCSHVSRGPRTFGGAAIVEEGIFVRIKERCALRDAFVNFAWSEC